MFLTIYLLKYCKLQSRCWVCFFFSSQWFKELMMLEVVSPQFGRKKKHCPMRWRTWDIFRSAASSIHDHISAPHCKQCKWAKQAKQNNLRIPNSFLANLTASMIQMAQVHHIVLCGPYILSQCAELGKVHLHKINWASKLRKQKSKKKDFLLWTCQ